MIKNYKEFKFEAIFESLILESKIFYSDKFVNLIKQIKGSKVADELLKIASDGVDKDFRQNYIDTSNEKDSVTFTLDSKAKEFFGTTDAQKYRVSHQDRYLTHSARNKEIFRRLNYTMPDLLWEPEVGTVGEIRAEAQSNMSQKIYVWFETDDGKRTVINKNALVPYDEKQVKIWDLQRNTVKIGRVARAILNAAGVEFTDKDIAEFVNSYKAAWEILSNGFIQFELVSGEKIPYWYNFRRYEVNSSTLGQSCMKSMDKGVFEIYEKNQNCKMLILYSDGGTIEDGQYRAKTIKGRALVWTTECGDIFMDRIYTNFDSDVNLFMKYAHDKKWWCKTSQDSSCDFVATNGVTTKTPIYVVKLENADLSEYPYVDTLSYLNTDDRLLSNDSSEINADKELVETDGTWRNMDDDW